MHSSVGGEHAPEFAAGLEGDDNPVQAEREEPEHDQERALEGGGVTGRSIVLFAAAALAEIGGAYLVWVGLRDDYR